MAITFSLPQSQEEFYFALPYHLTDLCLYAVNNGFRADEVVAVAGLTGDEVQKVFKDLAAKHDSIYVSSFFAGMGKNGMFGVMKMMQPDGIHPNVEGVVANVAAIGPAVLDLVGRARKAQ